VDQLIKEGFLAVGTGLREFSFTEALWLSRGGKTRNYSIMDLTSSEAMYARDEVTDDSTLKVGGITLRPYIGGKTKPVETSRVIGLYQINETQHEWGVNLVTRLKSERDKVGSALTPHQALPILLQNREWINDDKLLIEECLRLTENQLPGRGTTVFLISNDKRLANQMAETCNVYINRLSPEEFLTYWLGPPITSETQVSVDDLYSMGMLDGRTRRNGMVAVLMDYGSIASAAVRFAPPNESPNPSIKYIRRTISSGYQDTLERHRYCTYSLEQIGTYTRWATVKEHRPVRSLHSNRYGGMITTWSGQSLLSRSDTSVDWRSRTE
jgi:hypothetical protein